MPGKKRNRRRSVAKRVPVYFNPKRSPLYDEAVRVIGAEGTFGQQRKLIDLLILGREEAEQITRRWIEDLLGALPPDSQDLKISELRRHDPPSPLPEENKDPYRRGFGIYLHDEFPEQRLVWEFYDYITERLTQGGRPDRIAVGGAHQIYLKSAILAGVQIAREQTNPIALMGELVT